MRPLSWQRLGPHPDLGGELMAYWKSTESLTLPFTASLPWGSPTNGAGCRVVRGGQGKANRLVDLKTTVFSQRASRCLFELTQRSEAGTCCFGLFGSPPSPVRAPHSHPSTVTSSRANITLDFMLWGRGMTQDESHQPRSPLAAVMLHIWACDST